MASQGSNYVSVIDVPGFTSTDYPAVPGSNSVGVALSPNADNAYVTNRDLNTVSVIDTAHPGDPWGTISDPSFTLNGPIFVTFNPDENAAKAYVANFYGTTVSVIDTATQTVSNVIGVGNNPLGIAVNQAGTLAYVANYGSNSVSVIDTALNTVVETFSVGTNPYGLTLSPDGGTLYVATSTDNAVWVVTLKDGLWQG